ncbi:Cytochrome P450 [Penicillium expansum]|uniref:Cytochrome P450 n=1 Tax=Penicillium expansum TaxID=27334 RepID=A0A0A2JAU2_PENEN|nr:Cytochrome P450 [Penicillium expansum]KGO35829.1 Cytochrome P450 [Penicillium expansum]KGO43977.1 Cytochrome P450 [Penicillium expansum]KGO52474.1 Cytochrome P450 [Penicillium expansum]
MGLDFGSLHNKPNKVADSFAKTLEPTREKMAFLVMNFALPQWMARRGGASTNFAQITFLHGQRSCIGKDFARAELRCAIAGVVGRFLFEMQDPKQVIHVAGAVTIKPVEGTHLRIRRVDGW